MLVCDLMSLIISILQEYEKYPVEFISVVDK